MPDNKSPNQDSNPIIEVYRGHEIRHTNRVVFRLPPVDYKKIIDGIEDTGLSIRNVLAYSGQPCEKCKNIDIHVCDDFGNSIPLKRGILKVTHRNSGGNIRKYKGRAVVDTGTNKTYTSVKQVMADYPNVNYSTLIKKLSGEIFNDTTLRYL